MESGLTEEQVDEDGTVGGGEPLLERRGSGFENGRGPGVRGHRSPVSSSQRRPRLFEVAIAVPDIGLQMAPFGPFVPGVDEHQPPLGGLLAAGAGDRAAQPPAIRLGRRMDPGRAPFHPPGRVVP